MSDECRVGYEDLLRPIKDALLKNWSMSLAHVLDEFINHLQHDAVAMNFTQAAVLLQNSTAFYCKRVEVVFKLIEELNDGVCHLKTDEAQGSGLTPSKRKRIVRTLENDDLDLLDFVHSDHNIDLPVHKLKTVPPKQIVLNKEIKAVKKPNSSIPLSSASVFFGYKDDYRVFGKTWSDGTVNRDFRNDWTKKLVCSIETVTNGHEYHDDHVDSPEASLPDVNDNIHKNSLTNGIDVPLNGVSSREVDLPVPLKQPKVSLEKFIDWPPITFDFQLHDSLTKKRAFSLPKSLIAEAEMEREKRRKLDEKREARKEKALAKINAAMESKINADPMEVVDPEGTIDEGIECCPNALPVNGEDLFDGAPTSEILRFKQQRQQKGQEETELAKRVSDWHESVLPRLHEAESRRKFNVHEYGTKILDKIPDSDTSYHSFQELVEGQPRPEVCRFFLSTLMLANTYNVELRKTETDPLATDCLELRLLSKVRHHDEIDQDMDNLC